MDFGPFVKLMRLHQPAGIFLLLWPCWWAVALATPGIPPLSIFLHFALGAVLMRGAGCTLNDIVDRDIDAQVERTKDRPIASGAITVKQAQTLILLLVFISFLIAIKLGIAVVLWSFLALIPIAIYPWMKRISWWPQLFLGLTFNWGIFMGWAAMRGQVETPAYFLYLGSIFWTLGYDTIYAHQDKKDDARIGVKSSALRLGNKTIPYLLVWYALAVACWSLAGILQGVALWYYAGMLAALAHFYWQTGQVKLNDPASCRRIFISNAYQLGAIVFIATLLS